MLWGLDDFDSENDPIILATSSEVVGERKSEFGFLCLRKFEKWWLALGIEDHWRSSWTYFACGE